MYNNKSYFNYSECSTKSVYTKSPLKNRKDNMLLQKYKDFDIISLEEDIISDNCNKIDLENNSKDRTIVCIEEKNKQSSEETNLLKNHIKLKEEKLTRFYIYYEEIFSNHDDCNIYLRICGDEDNFPLIDFNDFRNFHSLLKTKECNYDNCKIKLPSEVSLASFKRLNLNEWLNDEVTNHFQFYIFR